MRMCGKHSRLLHLSHPSSFLCSRLLFNGLRLQIWLTSVSDSSSVLWLCECCVTVWDWLRVKETKGWGIRNFVGGMFMFGFLFRARQPFLLLSISITKFMYALQENSNIRCVVSWEMCRFCKNRFPSLLCCPLSHSVNHFLCHLLPRLVL